MMGVEIAKKDLNKVLEELRKRAREKPDDKDVTDEIDRTENWRIYNVNEWGIRNRNANYLIRTA